MTDSSRYRKLWSKSQAPIQLPAAVERKVKSRAVKEYDHYLTMLQQRNRLVRRLQRKSNQEVELEKREQGFALYLNGANISSQSHHSRAPPDTKDREQRTKPRERKRDSKTADASRAERDSSEDEDSPLRAKTAPSKRKGWGHDVVELRTEQGDPLHIQAPGILSGNYEDDFESTVEEVDAQQERDELAVSFDDIAILRSSLEGDDVIRSSLDRTRMERQDSLESLASSGSCSEELEEEGEEEKGSDQASLGTEGPPCDGIVLEFASLPSSRHGSGRSSMATRSLSDTSRKAHQPGGSAPSEVLEAIQWENATLGERTNHQQGQPVQRKFHLEGTQPGPTEVLPSNPLSMALAVRNSSNYPTESRLSPQPVSNASGPETPQRRPALGQEDQQQTLPTARDSLTEETLKVITEKVRKMDARKQHRLLYLLSRLDQPSSPLPPTDRHIKPELSLPGDSHSPGSASSLNPVSPEAPAVTQRCNLESSPDGGKSPPADATMEQAQKVSVRVHAVSQPTETLRTSEPSENQENSNTVIPPSPTQLQTISPSVTTQVNTHLNPATTAAIAQSSASLAVCAHSDSVEIQLCILSNWGHPTLVGLTEVEFFSSLDGKRVWLSSDRVCVGPPSGEEGDPGRLVNGKMKTTSSRHMWTHPYYLGQPLTLTFSLPPHMATDNPLKAVSKIRLWNYNKNIHELDVGVKRAQILVNGVLLWEGTVNKGCGSQVFDYCTDVSLDREEGSVVPVWLATETRNHSGVELDSDFLAPPPTRPSSGRVSGLRGQLLSRQSETATPLATPLQSISDPHLPTFLDDPQLPRLKTAVLAHGRRWFRVNSSGSETCLLPCVGASWEGKEGEGQREGRLSNLEQRATLPNTSPLATPSFSSCEPEVSTHQPRPPSDLDQTLASITKFDHTHLGQLGQDPQDDILESFLSEYRQRKQRTGGGSLPPSTEEPGEGVPGGEEEEEEEGWFPIPELPSGHELVLNILSTWGDHYYVGLSGMEVFTAQGERAWVEEISADPADINVLPQYSGDPRVVGNLLDGTNRTRDDTHMWLAPFTPGHSHLVRLKFSERATIAMIRIWNYNKSRIHSSRGAREVELHLDGKLIFRGEIARACGGLQGGTEAFGETILFTTDEDILLAVAEHDDAFQGEISCHHGDEEVEPEPLRPRTTDVGGGNSEELGDERPFTSACLPPQHSTATAQLTGQVLSVVLAATWGDPQYLGLTGVEVVDASGQPLSLTPEQIEVTPGLAEGGENWGGADRLIDGVNVTTDDQYMWLATLTPSTRHTLTLTLATPTALSALRVWNYNKSAEDTYRGVKVIHVFLDGREISPDGGFLLRRAPGNVHYNFAQLLPFQPSTSETTDEAASQSAPGTLPRGFVYQLQLLSTWGDPYYIGLTGLEFCNASGTCIPLTEDHIAAFPESVNVLPEVKGDVRTPDKLVDGSCDTDDGRHMWLAPLLPGIINSVYVVFDKPQIVSGVRLWNYAKTPSRGVKEFTILVDDLLVHSGTMPPVPSHARGILPTLYPPVDPHIVSFGEQDLWGAGEQACSSVDVQLTNDHQTLTARQQPQRPVASEDLRPLTSLTGASTRQQRWW